MGQKKCWKREERAAASRPSRGHEGRNQRAAVGWEAADRRAGGPEKAAARSSSRRSAVLAGAQDSTAMRPSPLPLSPHPEGILLSAARRRTVGTRGPSSVPSSSHPLPPLPLSPGLELGELVWSANFLSNCSFPPSPPLPPGAGIWDSCSGAPAEGVGQGGHPVVRFHLGD